MYLKHGRYQQPYESDSNRSTLPSISASSFIKKTLNHRRSNKIKSNQSTTLSSLNFTLDEWDKQHVKPTKENSQFWHRRLVRRSTKLIEEGKLDTLNFKTNVQKDFKMLKSMKGIKKLETFCKDIEEEKSAVLAHNINVAKRRFDFDVFKNGFSKVITSQVGITKPKIVEEKQELQQVGNEICIMRKIKRLDSKKDECEYTECKDDDEVKIEDRILRQNNLTLKGKYDQMINKENYKGIIMDKYKMEKILHEQISQTLSAIKEQKVLIEKINNEIMDLAERFNKSREHKGTLQDAYELLGRKSEMLLQTKNKTIEVLKEASSLQAQKNQLKEEYDEYCVIASNIEQEYINEIPKLKYKLKLAKNDVKCLIQLHDKMKEESKNYYYNILKEGIDVRDSGLSWVIYKLFEIDATVEEFQFPKFIDHPSYKYLMEYSKKRLLVAKLNTLIICIRNNFIKDQIKDCNVNKTSKSKVLKKTAFSKEKILNIINEFNNAILDKNVILTNEADLADEANTKKALQQIKLSTRKNYKIECNIDLFGQDRDHLNDLIKNCNVNKEEIFTAMVNIKEEISKLESEMLSMRKSQMSYIKKKYEGNRAKGISECVKYDLMFSALFGNHAII